MDSSNAADAMKQAHKDWKFIGNTLLWLGSLILICSFFVPTTADITGRFGLTESVANFHGIATQMMVVMIGLAAILCGAVCKGVSAIIRAMRAQVLVFSLSEEGETASGDETTA